MKFSLNNRFIVEPYLSDRAIKSTNTGGFAMISQKVTVKGLKLLVDAHLTNTRQGIDQNHSYGNMIVPAGSTVFIREEYLHNAPWAKQILESEGIEGKFMIVDQQYVEFVQT